jgi:hypothetical protein
MPPSGGMDVYLEKALFWFRLKGDSSAGAGSTLHSLLCTLFAAMLAIWKSTHK